ncbi:hypothetical protein SBV1_2480019 [Verrucomicrobia bacterium]|nr:hypothetical protein SBV1_2480019 [Verrucomicrobiota bacterium]
MRKSPEIMKNKNNQIVMKTTTLNQPAARTGKIARLPRHIREDLNERLQQGKEGKSLLPWLNSLEATQDVLDLHFDGAPINAQNLSEWRQGGYREWLADQQRRDVLRHVADQAQGFEEAGEGARMSDRLSSVLVAELAVSIHALLGDGLKPAAEGDDPAATEKLELRWKRLQGLVKALTNLRREDTKAQVAQVAFERWRFEEEIETEEHTERRFQRDKQRLTEQARAILKEPLMAKMYGGGKAGEEAAKLMTKISTGATLLNQNDDPEEEPEPTPKKAQAKSAKPAKALKTPKPAKAEASATVAQAASLSPAHTTTQAGSTTKAEKSLQSNPIKPNQAPDAGQGSASPAAGRRPQLSSDASKRNPIPCEPENRSSQTESARLAPANLGPQPVEVATAGKALQNGSLDKSELAARNGETSAFEINRDGATSNPLAAARNGAGNSVGDLSAQPASAEPILERKALTDLPQSSLIKPNQTPSAGQGAHTPRHGTPEKVTP